MNINQLSESKNTRMLTNTDAELKDLLDSELKWLNQHKNIIDFVSIGGSTGIFRKFFGNDLDVFIHCEDNHLSLCRSLIEKEISTRYKFTKFRSSPYLVDSFGIRYAVVRDNGINIDYFILSPSLTFGYESFNHHILYIGENAKFTLRKKTYRNGNPMEQASNAIDSTFIRIFTYSERMVKSFRKEQYFESERSFVALRAILYGLNKWLLNNEEFDWFRCNLLDESVDHSLLRSQSNITHRILKEDIKNLLNFVLVILEHPDFESKSDAQSAYSEISKLLISLDKK